jgi:hypothetical protein
MNEDHLIYENYINSIVREEFSSSINRRSKYCLYGFRLNSATEWGHGRFPNDEAEKIKYPGVIETVEECLFSSESGDIMFSDIVTDVTGDKTDRDEDIDVYLSDVVVKSIGCTLDDDPLLIKGRYEAAIAYKIRLSVLQADPRDPDVLVVTEGDDKRFGTGDLVNKNFHELKNIAKNSYNKLLTSGKSGQHLIPGIKYTSILHLIQ